jgi:hypothetical protein
MPRRFTVGVALVFHSLTLTPAGMLAQSKPAVPSITVYKAPT